MSYTSAVDVANLLEGLTEDDIRQEWLDWADDYIDQLTDRRFVLSNVIIEKFDIFDTSTDTIFLSHYPIKTVTYLKDDGETIDSTDYVIYNDSGIIRLKLESYLWKVVKSWFFTKGYQSVEVKYNYGIDRAPDIVAYFATLLTANTAANALINKVTGLGLKSSEQIGDYSYRLQNSGEDGVLNTIKTEITRVEDIIKRRYANEPESKAI